ncbi:MAG: translation initiation factor IF-3 [Candidatus Sabulitectum sp.]|nr:translation initiation factor IF-3 [Candidatus Sabulitectum sp.]
MANSTRVNGEIRSQKVRLIDQDGEHVGVLDYARAMEMAGTADLDLVEISGASDPPVCRIMDYGKYRYQLNRKEREARKKQHSGGLKEVKFRPNTDTHDYNFKMRHARDFLEARHKVKATVVFRGRQMVYKDQGYDLLSRLSADLEDLAQIERKPVMEGRFLTMILAPRREKNT